DVEDRGGHDAVETALGCRLEDVELGGESDEAPHARERQQERAEAEANRPARTVEEASISLEIVAASRSLDERRGVKRAEGCQARRDHVEKGGAQTGVCSRSHAV